MSKLTDEEKKWIEEMKAEQAKLAKTDERAKKLAAKVKAKLPQIDVPVDMTVKDFKRDCPTGAPGLCIFQGELLEGCLHINPGTVEELLADARSRSVNLDPSEAECFIDMGRRLGKVVENEIKAAAAYGRSRGLTDGAIVAIVAAHLTRLAGAARHRLEHE